MKLCVQTMCLAVGTALFWGGCASSDVKNPGGIGGTEMKADERGFVAGTGINPRIWWL